MNKVEKIQCEKLCLAKPSGFQTYGLYIYNEDKTQILATLSNNERVYVSNYNKDNEYSLVKYKTEDLNTIIGYVKTDYIEMDEIDNNKILLITITIVSALILCIIITTYIIIKKKK